MNIQKYFLVSFLIVNSLIHNIFAQEPQQQAVTQQAMPVDQPPLLEQPVVPEQIPASQPMEQNPSVAQPTGQPSNPSVIVQQQPMQTQVPASLPQTQTSQQSVSQIPVSSTPAAQPGQMPSLVPQAGPSLGSLTTLPVSLAGPIMPPSTPIVQAPEPDFIEKSQKTFKEGIDTVEQVDSGNWWEKRRAFKSAKPKYEESRKLVGIVDESSEEFFNKLSSFDKLIDEFYISSGIDQGEIHVMLDTSIKNLEKERDTRPQGLNDEQFKELNDLNEKKYKNLESLKLNFEKIKKINENVRESILNTLTYQVKTARSFEDKSLESYYRISEILDDRKARGLLNDMQTYNENIQAILNWINVDLKNYVNQSIEKAKELINQMNQQIANLKEQGIALSKKASQQEQAELELKKKKEAQEKALKEKEAKESGFFSRIFRTIGSFFSSTASSIANFFKNIFSSFTRAPKPKVKDEQVKKKAVITNKEDENKVIAAHPAMPADLSGVALAKT